MVRSPRHIGAARESRLETPAFIRTSNSAGSTEIARRCGPLAHEDFKIADMTTSACDSVDQSRRHVRQKTGLDQRLLAQGWNSFANRLSDKREERGGHVLTVEAGTIQARHPALETPHPSRQGRR